MKDLPAFLFNLKGYMNKAIWISKVTTILFFAYIFLIFSTKPFELYAQYNFPQLTGYVVDNAHLLNDEALQSLTKTLSDYEQKTGDQIIVTTVESLADYTIEDYSNALFRHWGIGQKKVNNGVFFLIAPNERSLRIEVGYGLEGVLTDATTSIIINSLILPEFRDGNYQQGIIIGTNAIIEALQGDQAELLNRIKVQKEIAQKKQADEQRLNIFINILIFLFVFIVFGLPLLASIFGKQIGPKKYKWLGIVFILWFQDFFNGGGGFGGGRGGGRGGGFGGGGGSSGGGGASGRW